MKTLQLAQPKETSHKATALALQASSQKTSQNSCGDNSEKNYKNRQYRAPNHKIFCCYVNSTAQFQIIRVTTAASGLIERTVPPYARVLFEADWRDHLEVHTGNLMSAIHSDTIPCHQFIYLD